jgi:hypothetical protein
VISELRPRSVGEILDAAVRLYRARFGALMRVTVAVLLPVSAVSLVVLLSAVPDDFTVSIGGDVTPVYDESDAAVGVAATIVVLLVSVVATGFVTAAVTRIVADAYVDVAENTGEAVRAARRRVLAVIGLTIVSAVGIAGASLACIAPGLWLMAAWSVAIPVLILEGTGVFRALGRSLQLARSGMWLAFGVVVIGRLLTLAISTGLAEVIDLAIIRTSDSASADVIAQSVASFVSSVITTPFIATALVALYFDLRTRAEAFDVQMLIARLDARSGPVPAPSR